MVKIRIMYKPVEAVESGSPIIFGGYDPSSLENDPADTLEFIQMSVAHPGVVAALKQAYVQGVIVLECDEDLAVYYQELSKALEPQGFIIREDIPSEKPFDIDGVVYENLADAINAVGEDGVIKLESSGDSSGIAVAEGKSFVIDLNGYQLDLHEPGAGSAGTKTNGFQFLKDSTVVIKDGVIVAHPGLKILIQNYSNLTLDNVKLYGVENTQYLSSNNYGDVVYKNGTAFYPVGNNCAFDVYYGMSPDYDGGVTVTVADTSVEINGRVEYGKASRASEEMFEANARLTVPVSTNFSVDCPEGYHWVADGDMKHLAK